MTSSSICLKEHYIKSVKQEKPPASKANWPQAVKKTGFGAMKKKLLEDKNAWRVPPPHRGGRECCAHADVALAASFLPQGSAFLAGP